MYQIDILGIIMNKVKIILASTMLLTLIGCIGDFSTNKYGVKIDEWKTLSKEEKIAAINAYTAELEYKREQLKADSLHELVTAKRN